MFRVLEGLNWEIPDWIIVPGGNLGNSSSFGKAFMELKELGLVDRVPRIAIINATGANTLYEVWNEKNLRWNDGRFDDKAINAHFKELDDAGRRAVTLASAIEIGRPVNLSKALRTLDVMDGVVRQVSDEVLLEYKALIGQCGFGCEPASAASLAGAKMLLDEGVIGKNERVACVLTGACVERSRCNGEIPHRLGYEEGHSAAAGRTNRQTGEQADLRGRRLRSHPPGDRGTCTDVKFKVKE